MDWPLGEPAFFEEDFDSVFLYQPRRSKAVYRFDGDTDITERWLDTDEDITKWLDEVNAQKTKPGLAVILGARAEERNNRHNPAILEYLPFSRASFERIAESFPLHGDTARVVNRSNMAYFTDINLLNSRANALFQILRTTATYPGDLALSTVSKPVAIPNPQITSPQSTNSSLQAGSPSPSPSPIPTPIPNSNPTPNPTTIAPSTNNPQPQPQPHAHPQEQQFHTRALILGLTPAQQTAIANRLSAANVPSPRDLAHPLLLPGVLAELERERHLRLVQQRVFQLLQRVRALSKGNVVVDDAAAVAAGGGAAATGGGGVGEAKGDGSVDLWIEVCLLRMGLQAWMGEMGKVEGCCERGYSGGGRHGGDGGGDKAREGGKEEGREMEMGSRIKKRLGEIRADYEGKVRECSMVIEGMALSAQLSWNQIGYQDTQTNLTIARDTRRDSNQMRSIAFLTMFFLPATFMASLFSTTFFKWDATDGQHVVSPYLWIYPVMTITVTAVVIGCWFYFTRWRKPANDDVERRLLKQP